MRPVIYYKNYTKSGKNLKLVQPVRFKTKATTLFFILLKKIFQKRENTRFLLSSINSDFKLMFFNKSSSLYLKKRQELYNAVYFSKPLLRYIKSVK